MPTEQRIISSRGGAPARPAPAGAATDAAPAAEATPTRRKPLTLVVVLVLVLGAAAAWYFLMGPGAAEAEGGETPVVEEAEAAPEPGEVLTIDPISLNLAGGSYLRIGVALQLTADVAHAPDPAVALDHVIDLFSGRPVEEVSSAEGREALRAELAVLLEEAYHGDVMGVYLTDYVTQ